MPYLIDGNNLIGHIPDMDLGDRSSRFHLIARLVQFQKIRNTRVIVVFDGPPDELLDNPGTSSPPVSVFFPEAGRRADTVIEAIIQQQTDLRRFYVVSSDREIRDFTRRLGAKSLDCAEFNKRIKEAQKKYREKAALEKPNKDLSPLEVRQWGEVFTSKK